MSRDHDLKSRFERFKKMCDIAQTQDSVPQAVKEAFAYMAQSDLAFGGVVIAMIQMLAVFPDLRDQFSIYLKTTDESLAKVAESFGGDWAKTDEDPW